MKMEFKNDVLKINFGERALTFDEVKEIFGMIIGKTPTGMSFRTIEKAFDEAKEEWKKKE